MSIRKWHLGKLVILWMWGGAGVAFALTRFLAGDWRSKSTLFCLIFAVLDLLLLSAVTWHWLGGKESD
jgi:hypothetical protein